MSRRIILVDLCWTRNKDPGIPLGHASLIAALGASPKNEIRSLVVPVNASAQPLEQFAAELLDQAAPLSPGSVDIAIGAYIWGEEKLRGILSSLRRLGFTGRIIIGGPQVSYCGAGLENRYPEADVFVRGYAEEALRAVVRTPEHQFIQGVHWAGEADLQEQAQVDLGALPSPWLTGIIPLDKQRFVRWETQRGCPYRCSFCQHRDPGARPCRQVFSAARIDEEIDLFCRSDVRDIAVLDPIFNVHPRAPQILDRFRRRGYQGRLSLQCRAESVAPAFLDAAAHLDVCLEIGLQTIHEREAAAIQRRNHLGKVERVLDQLQRRGIAHEVSIIYGLPGQTLDSFRQTVSWCVERRVPVIKAFPLLLLRGTALDVQRDRWGLTTDTGPLPVVVASRTFSHGEWRAMARIAEALRRTEGQHPVRLSELLHMAARMTAIAKPRLIGVARSAA